MTKLRLKLPHWTAHPGFGVAVLLALAVALIVHGEPQPSSRPSGKSVVANGTSTATIDLPASLIIRQKAVEWRQKSTVKRVALPADALPRQLVTAPGMGVVLAVRHGRQHAYAIGPKLSVTDLGLADAVIPAASATAAVIVETALTNPGMSYLAEPDVTASATPSSSASSTSVAEPPLGDFVARRYGSSARKIGSTFALPPGMRLATDTAVGVVAWKPANRVFDAGTALESLSAAATLIRPDGSFRRIGAVHPLAASATDLLVWDVGTRRFGLMPLQYVTSTATTTRTPTPSVASSAPSPSASPSTVAGVNWFERTRGFVVTGPASFAPDDSAFAVYALVGSRRRLVVAQVAKVGTDQIEVLALVQPVAKPSPSRSDSETSSADTPTPTPTPTVPAFEPDGFPIAAPLTPDWWGGRVVGVATDGTVIGYKPGSDRASLLDLGVGDIDALGPAP